MSSFDDAFRLLIGHEGGYVNDPADPGGETKFGVSKRSYPREDIRNLTLERAKAIYRRDFWDRVGADALPWSLAFALFDAAVNSGPEMAVKLLQRAAGVTDDGRFGPITRAAVAAVDPAVLAARLTGHRLTYMTRLKTWPVHGKGWARRLGANLAGLS